MLYVVRDIESELDERLRASDAVTADLISSVIAAACPRFCALSAAAKVKVNWLVQAGAWTDATFALLKIELPQWAVWRLSQNGGKWICCLSKKLESSAGHYEVADSSHQLLPLAILRALLRVRRSAACPDEPLP